MPTDLLPPVPAIAPAITSTTPSSTLSTRLGSAMAKRGLVTLPSKPAVEAKPIDAPKTTAPAKPVEGEKPAQPTTPDLDEDLEPTKPTDALDKTEENAVPGDNKLPSKPPEPDGRATKKSAWKHYHDEKAKNATLTAELEKLKSALADPAEHPKFKEEVSKRTELETKLKEVSRELEFARFERSPRFREDYLVPIMDASERGRKAMTALDVTDAQGNVRAGTAADFDRLMSIQDPRARRTAARELFADDAAALMEFAKHEDKVDSLSQKASQALEDYQKKGSEREKEQQETAQKQTQKLAKEVGDLWQKHTRKLMDAEGKWFQPVEGDTEGNKLLQEGFDQVKTAFSNLNLLDPKMTAQEREERVAGQIDILLRGAAYKRLQHLYKQRGALLKKAKTALAQYRQSEPIDGEARGKGPAVPPTMEQRVLAGIKQKGMGR